MKRKTLLITALALTPLILPSQAKAESIGFYYKDGPVALGYGYGHGKHAHHPKVIYKKPKHHSKRYYRHHRPVHYEHSYTYKQAAKRATRAYLWETRAPYFNGYRYPNCR